jgi:NADP-dependent aldehyde dehydrogenase
MEINATQIIGFRNVKSTGPEFYGYNPVTGKSLPTVFQEATASDINESAELADRAFKSYRKTTTVQRSEFLEKIATHLEARGDELLSLIQEETALPIARLTGERSRTTAQLRLFAQLLRDGKWNKVITDEALPDRKPAARPEMNQVQTAIGVVAVFGARNFPLAFSVAGGDTASALAAGCPVIFKAHPAHPATCQLVGETIAKAAKDTGMPEGVFSMLHGISHDTGSRLVTHPLIKAVAFTGSFRGGKSLYDLAVRRKEPIPVYAEMGSVNPVFFLPDAIKQGGELLAGPFAQSVLLGSGQFCTNPGLCIFMNTEESRQFIQQVAQAMSAPALHPLLTRAIDNAFAAGLEKQIKLPGIQELTIARKDPGLKPWLRSVAAKQIFQNPDYFEEVFGPSTMAVMTDNMDEMYRLAEIMPGQLTATIHATEKEYSIAKELIDRLTQKAGRVVMNGFPTGVEVCHAMVHGGPFPATTDSRATSVGTSSIYRFTRPVCYQNIPAVLLKEIMPS